MKAERIEQFYNFMCDGIAENEVARMAEKLERMGFFDAPASINHHGKKPGDLFLHSLTVAQNLVYLTDRMGLQWERLRSPYLVGMLHDLCKTDNYIRNEDEEWMYNNAPLLPGHGDKSVIMALQMGCQLTEEEIACIRWHMGAFDDKQNWNHYGNAVTRYHNVLWTHTADMMAARIAGI